MNAHAAIKDAIDKADKIVRSYLEDLTDAELLVRPVEGANHIAWQFGHLISSEHRMVEAVCPGAMPKLPEGFVQQHNKDAAVSNDASAFLTKSEYLDIYTSQRAGTLQALDSLSAEDLDKPGPESLKRVASHVVGIFTMQAVHWTMHAGQWAVIRRKLGRKPLF